MAPVLRLDDDISGSLCNDAVDPDAGAEAVLVLPLWSVVLLPRDVEPEAGVGVAVNVTTSVTKALKGVPRLAKMADGIMFREMSPDTVVVPAEAESVVGTTVPSTPVTLDLSAFCAICEASEASTLASGFCSAPSSPAFFSEHLFPFFVKFFEHSSQRLQHHPPFPHGFVRLPHSGGSVVQHSLHLCQFLYLSPRDSKVIMYLSPAGHA
jgi:hypothetical protein